MELVDFFEGDELVLTGQSQTMTIAVLNSTNIALVYFRITAHTMSLIELPPGPRKRTADQET